MKGVRTDSRTLGHHLRPDVPVVRIGAEFLIEDKFLIFRAVAVRWLNGHELLLQGLFLLYNHFWTALIWVLFPLRFPLLNASRSSRMLTSRTSRSYMRTMMDAMLSATLEEDTVTILRFCWSSPALFTPCHRHV